MSEEKFKKEMERIDRNLRKIKERQILIESVLKDYLQERVDDSLSGYHYDNFLLGLIKRLEDAGGNPNYLKCDFVSRDEMLEKIKEPTTDVPKLANFPSLVKMEVGTDAPAVYTPFPMLTPDEYRRNLCEELLTKQAKEFVKDLKDIQTNLESKHNIFCTTPYIKEIIEKWEKRLEEREK